MLGYYKSEAPVRLRIGISITGRQFDRVEMTPEDFSMISKTVASGADVRPIVEWLAYLHTRMSPESRNQKQT